MSRDDAEVRALRVIVALGDTRSVSATAERLGMSRSTVRQCVSDLERALRVQLVATTANRARLTEAGRRFAHDARCMIRDYRALQGLVRSQGESPSGTMDIAAPIGLALDVAPSLVSELLTRHPTVDVRWRACLEPIEELHRGADCALTLRVRKDIDMDAIPLAPISLRAFASETYLERAGAIGRLDDVEGHTVLGWTECMEDPNEWPLRHGETASVRFTGWASNLSPIVDIVAEGHAIALLPTQCATGLVPVLPHEVGAEMTLWWVAPRTRATDTRMQRIRATVTEVLRASTPAVSE